MGSVFVIGVDEGLCPDKPVWQLPRVRAVHPDAR
jgi:hypothetical protein